MDVNLLDLLKQALGPDIGGFGQPVPWRAGETHADIFRRPAASIAGDCYPERVHP